MYIVKFNFDDKDKELELNKPKIENLIFYFLGKKLKYACPENTGVITACDSNAFVGFQLLYSSLLVSHDIPIVVMNLGLTEEQLEWCNKQCDLQVLSNINLPFANCRDKWQTWNKPFYIEQSPFINTLWIDSDCIVNKSIVPVLDSLRYGPVFTPDSGQSRENNSHSCQDNLYKLLPIENVFKDDYPFVNAGVVGLNLRRDKKILSDWKFAVIKAAKNYDIRMAMRWYDQAALKWAIQKNNAPISLDSGINYLYPQHIICEPVKLFKQIITIHGRIIHFVGKSAKPWSQWGEMLDLDFSNFPLDMISSKSVFGYQLIDKPRTKHKKIISETNENDFIDFQKLYTEITMTKDVEMSVSGVVNMYQAQWCEKHNIKNDFKIIKSDKKKLMDIKVKHYPISDKLKLFVLHSNQKMLNLVKDRPYIKKINLETLDIGKWNVNKLCENRFYISAVPDLVKQEYIGFASAKWNQKYTKNLNLEHFYLLENELSPKKVFVAHQSTIRWATLSDKFHVGMMVLLKDLAQEFDMKLLSGNSFWANNFICHNLVFQNFILFWRDAFRYLVKNYNLEFDFNIGNENPDLKPSYLLERVTTMYFANRPDLKIIQLNKKDYIKFN